MAGPKRSSFHVERLVVRRNKRKEKISAAVFSPGNHFEGKILRIPPHANKKK